METNWELELRQNSDKESHDLKIKQNMIQRDSTKNDEKRRVSK